MTDLILRVTLAEDPGAPDAAPKLTRDEVVRRLSDILLDRRVCPLTGLAHGDLCLSEHGHAHPQVTGVAAEDITGWRPE